MNKTISIDPNKETRNSYVVGISMVKNEADVIEIFVRNNLRFIDALVILDNNSSDATREILVRLMTEGLPLVILDDPDPVYEQSRKMTGLLYATARAMSPNWILPLDADEMLLPTSEIDLYSALNSVAKYTIGLLDWRTYVPTSSDNLNDTNVITRITHRRANEGSEIYKIAIPRDLYERAPVIIAQGNHALLSKGGGYHRSQKVTEFLIAHFPVRNKKQVIGKAIIGWLAHLANKYRKKGQGHQWETIYQSYLKAGDISDREFYSLAQDYANGCTGGLIYDPYPIPNQVKIFYPELQEDCTLNKVVRFSEELAIKVGGNPDALESVHGPLLPNFGSLIDNDGAWNLKLKEEHMHCDVAPFRFLNNLFKPNSILEIGFGVGAYLQLFRNWGVQKVRGVDISDIKTNLFVPDAIERHDLRHPLNLQEQFDLVICSGVFEKIPEKYEEGLIKSINNHAPKAILFIVPYADELRMISERRKTSDYWIDVWRTHGWHCLIFQSLGLRITANISTLQHNAIIFVREDHPLRQSASTVFTLNDLRALPCCEVDRTEKIYGYYPVTLVAGSTPVKNVISTGSRTLIAQIVMLIQKVIGRGSTPLHHWIKNRIARLFGM